MRSMLRFTMAALALAAAVTPAAAQPDFFGTGRRAWLGFSYDTEITRRDGEIRQTLVIRDVVSGAPADVAGLEVGDTLVAINDINATDQFISSLAYSLEPGAVVQLRVRRGGREHTLSVEAAEPPAEYRRLTPGRGVVLFDADSLRGRLRVLIDSAQLGVDSLRIPNLYVERGPGRLRIYGDSLGTFRAFPLDSFTVSVDSLARRYHFFADSAWFEGADSLGRTWPRVFELSRGSRRFGPDSAFVYGFGPRAFTLQLDSLRELHAPFTGITVWGARAIAGAELTELNTDLGEYFGTDHGVLVVRVPDGTPAAEAGLAAGDVIVTAADRPVASIAELRRAVARSQRGEPIALEVIRKRERITLRLER